MSEKKLLAILGGPHQQGITAAMLEIAVQAARQAGWQVQQVVLYEKELRYCQGCERCVETGACVLQDDLQEIIQAMKTCDVVAVAAPTYWGNVPAALKNLFDRLLGVAMDDRELIPKPRFSPNQRYFLMTSCHTPMPFSSLYGQSSGALHAMKEFFHTGGMKCLGKVTCAGTRGKKTLPLLVQRRIQNCMKRLS